MSLASHCFLCDCAIRSSIALSAALLALIDARVWHQLRVMCRTGGECILC